MMQVENITVVLLISLMLGATVTAAYTGIVTKGGRLRTTKSRSEVLLGQQKSLQQGRGASLFMGNVGSKDTLVSSAGEEKCSSSPIFSLPTWTRTELEDFAQREGVLLSISTLGLAYRAVARSTHNSTHILGYIEGLIRPTGQLLHLDKMEVYRTMVSRARTENRSFRGGGTALGVGLLLGYLCLLHGQDNGCRQAEFLAIDDADLQHKRLVRYYQTSGFKIIKYVGDSWMDIPDRLVWGGQGTLLRQDISFLLLKWTLLLDKSQRKSKESGVWAL